MSEQDKLRSWMHAQGYTESTLADEVGMHYVSVFRMLRERRISSGFKLRFISRFGQDVATQVFDLPSVPEPVQWTSRQGL